MIKIRFKPSYVHIICNNYHDYVKGHGASYSTSVQTEVHVPEMYFSFLLLYISPMQLVHDSPKAQKYLMGGFEQVVGLYVDKLMPKVPALLKTLYDLDLLEEEVIQAWAKKVSTI